MIGVDGLQPDFLSNDVTPAMTYLARCGVTAQSLVPTYPTTTFPNMYSIATVRWSLVRKQVINDINDFSVIWFF